MRTVQDNAFGFLGAGHLAEAIVSGLVLSDPSVKSLVYLQDIDPARAQAAKARGVEFCATAEELLACCRYIFLTIRPQVYDEVLAHLASVRNGTHCFIAVAPGKTIAHCKSFLGADAPVIRAMPNTPLLVGQGATALASEPPVSAEELDTIRSVFSASGLTVDVNEAHFDAVIAVSGSAPAYAYMLASAVTSHAASLGLPKDIAAALIAQTILGAGEMLRRSGKSAAQLTREVSSPGGTTEQAVRALEEQGFASVVAAAMDACVRRSIELSAQN